ncbi:MAG: transposase [Candidatus Omnitrophica bacterium]|nr:transposase [Candidatus Omnitrophota bacterium]
MIKTYKFRAYPNKATEAQTNVVLELCRQMYNLALEQRIMVYKQSKKSLTCYDQINQLPELKKEFTQFNKIPAQSLQDVVKRLDKAYQSFFRRIKTCETPGFPRFKSFNRYDSFTLMQNNGYKLEKSNLILSKIGIFKLKLHRQIPLEAKIKTVTIIRKNNKWFVCFCCGNIISKVLPKVNRSIGIDVGCESFLTDSNGLKVENPRFLNKSTERITKLSQKLEKQVKGSNRRKKTKLLLGKAHEKVSNQRLDFQHKVAKHYVKHYDTICHEKMNCFKSFKGLNRSMRDVAWFQFFDILSYKAEEAGRKIVKVPAKNTSQQCSKCGKIVKKDLSVRIHSCPHCELILDRDHNAALNILRLGTSLQDPTSILDSSSLVKFNDLFVE